MKRCPECRKDYYDDSLLYCLDDGSALVQGSVTDEPATALLRGEDKTWPLGPTSAPGADGKEKRPILRFMRYSILKWPAVFAVVAAMALTAYLFGRAGSVSGGGVIPRRANIAISTPLALGKYCPLGVGRTAVALSPDGSLLVYVGEKDGAPVLMARPLDSFEDRYLPGTEGAYAPFFSPDGRSIAFFANNELKRLSLDGGQPVTLCEARNAHGGAWGPDGTIIFADGEGGRLVRIPASGGQPVLAFRREGLSAAIWGFSSPEILPDGDTVIATFWNSPNPDKYKIGVFSLRSGGARILVEGGMNPRYLPTGHLVYSRSSTLIAAPFDAREGKITGPEVTLAENVRSEGWGSVQYTLAK
ncbi:MAG: PD40 domain-containing protein [Acidobacteria bacterium]|nr:PD40 domain-containing protein [Acidobacteriota bacterium]